MRFKEFLSEEIHKPSSEEVLAEFQNFKEKLEAEFEGDTVVSMNPGLFNKTIVYWHGRTKEIIFPSVKVEVHHTDNRISTSNYPFLWNTKTQDFANLITSKGVDRKLKNRGEALAAMTDDEELRKKIYQDSGNWYEIEL